VSFSILVREATDAEIQKCEANASTEDGAAAIYVDGDLVAVTDEYGTAYLCAGSNATPTKDIVEIFTQAAMHFYSQAAFSADV
jgi:hypothetical protein